MERSAEIELSRTESNSFRGLSSIEFYLVRLDYSLIGFQPCSQGLLRFWGSIDYAGFGVGTTYHIW